MKTTDLKELKTLRSISTNFGIKKDFLDKILSTTDYLTIYEKMEIPKKNIHNGFRVVYKAEYFFADFHKQLLLIIETYIIKRGINNYIHNSAHGFIKGKNTLSNANIHINKQELLQVDIKSFFKSISIDKIEKVFLKLECNDDIAKIMSKLCTINGVLEEGLNTSPMLANLYFYELDKILFKLSKKYKCEYSRYADDITFSSDETILKETDLLNDIGLILKSENLLLANNKTRYSKYGQSQYVTGLSISNPIKPRIPRKIKQQIRQEFYFIKKYGFYSHFNRRNEKPENGFKRINGWIDYIMNVEPDLGKKLQGDYDTFG